MLRRSSLTREDLTHAPAHLHFTRSRNVTGAVLLRFHRTIFLIMMLVRRFTLAAPRACGHELLLATLCDADEQRQRARGHTRDVSGNTAHKLGLNAAALVTARQGQLQGEFALWRREYDAMVYGGPFVNVSATDDPFQHFIGATQVIQRARACIQCYHVHLIAFSIPTYMPEYSPVVSDAG